MTSATVVIGALTIPTLWTNLADEEFIFSNIIKILKKKYCLLKFLLIKISGSKVSEKMCLSLWRVWIIEVIIFTPTTDSPSIRSLRFLVI